MSPFALRSAARGWFSLVCLMLFACEGSTPGLGTADGSTCTDPSSCPEVDAGFDASLDIDAGGVRVNRLEIMPAPAALTLEAEGSPPTQQFSAQLVFEDDSTVPVASPRWSLTGERIGTINEASGLFTSSGRAGSATVAASVIVNGVEFSATAPLVVSVDRIFLAPGFNAGDTSKFDAAGATGPAGTPAISYPLDGVVMPQNAAPANIQWQGGVAGDLYRVRIEKPNATVNAYLQHGGGVGTGNWLVDSALWTAIARADGEAPANVFVDRYVTASATVLTSEPVEMVFANATLAGSTYFWNLGSQRLRRIDDGQTDDVDFMPSPPSGCAGCHAVSSTGRYLAARLGNDGLGTAVGSVFDLTEDLSGPAPVPEYPITASSPNWVHSSWSPDDLRLVIATFSLGLQIIDPFSGSPIAVSGSLPSSQAHNPAWAPDNSAILYVANTTVSFSNQLTGDLALLPITGPDAFGPSQIIHVGSSLNGNPAGVSDNYPTWGPDSQRIVFAHGNGSQSNLSNAALYIIGRDGNNLVRLDVANGASVRNFQPHFSPFDQGGYQWLSFLSLRAYGNPDIGSAGGVPQIWVSAIRKDVAPGEDPSVVPYWLPGQNPKSANISVQWTPQACRANGQSCNQDGECCTEECNGAGVCVAPPECRDLGETCSEDGDCCGALVCASRACSEPLI